MNVTSLKIRLPAPLRAVRLAAPPTPAELTEQALARREQAAYERGLQEGEQALSEQLMQQRGELVELQNGVLQSLRDTVPQVIRETEQTVTALALEVAQKLVAGLPIDAEVVVAAVREAMAQVEENTEFNIYLHPDDLELLRRANADLLEPRPGTQPIYFHPATEVTRGGCLVRTRFGVIDGQRETKMEMLKKSLVA